MTNTTNLALPYIEAAQSQKHVTHNAALAALDAIVMLSVFDRDLTAPPGSPADGARYLVAGSATGAWAGKDGKIAAYQDGAWAYYTAKEGWLCYVADEDVLIAYNGSSWAGPSAQNVALMGVNTTADATNKLSVASAAVLQTHVGNGTQYKLNKNAAGDTASFLFQTNWSGRAEMGTCGNDDFEFKTSPDGSTWSTGLTLVSAAKGVPKLPSFATGSLPSAATAGAGALAYGSTPKSVVVSDGAAWNSQPVAVASGVAQSYTGGTSKHTLATVTIPAGVLGPNGYVEIEAIWSFTNNANAKNPLIEFGGDAVFGIGGTSISSAAMRRVLWNRNSASSQVSWVSNNGNSYSTTTGTIATHSVDTTSAVDIVFSCTLASAGDTATLEAYFVRYRYGA